MSEKLVTGPDVKPLWEGYPIEEWERTLDPWHRDAFPEHLQDQIPCAGEARKEGWIGYDWAGNPIIFVADGTEIEVAALCSVCGGGVYGGLDTHGTLANPICDDCHRELQEGGDGE